MNAFFNLLIAVQMLSALGMIGLILVQHGKGADMGAAFGSGSAGSLFGASGSANFLSRTTAVLAVVFFGCTLGLAYLGHSRPQSGGGDSLLERAAATAPAPEPAAAPAQPAPAAGGAAQIPGDTAPAAQPGAPAADSSAPAPGAAQIPTK